LATAVEKVREKYQGKVTFIVLYQREAHPGQMNFKDISQPDTYDQRVHLANRTCSELQVATTIVIDDMEDSIRKKYGGLPNSTYIIAKGGVIVHKEPWAKPAGWYKILDKVLAEVENK
jgi:hypothetical protein